MLKYIISTFFLLVCFTGNAQTQKLDTLSVQTDSNNPFYHPKTYGLRIGVNLLKPIVSFTNDAYKGTEIVADWRINTRWFFAGELGATQKSIEEDYYDHEVKGTYLRAGLNYNLYTNWLDMDNEIYFGFRYGMSSFSSQLNNYTIAQDGDYFEPKTVLSTSEFKDLNAHWLELVMGLKVEVLNNLYMGMMVNVNKLITTNDPNNFKNTYSPGFGNITKNNTGANINYTISYRIPLYKK